MYATCRPCPRWLVGEFPLLLLEPKSSRGSLLIAKSHREDIFELGHLHPRISTAVLVRFDWLAPASSYTFEPLQTRWSEVPNAKLPQQHHLLRKRRDLQSVKKLRCVWLHCVLLSRAALHVLWERRDEITTFDLGAVDRSCQSSYLWPYLTSPVPTLTTANHLATEWTPPLLPFPSCPPFVSTPQPRLNPARVARLCFFMHPEATYSDRISLTSFLPDFRTLTPKMHRRAPTKPPRVRRLLAFNSSNS